MVAVDEIIGEGFRSEESGVRISGAEFENLVTTADRTSERKPRRFSPRGPDDLRAFAVHKSAPSVISVARSVSKSYPQGGTGIPAGATDYIYYGAQWSVE